ncbi:MAG TPA: SulP family inorganic anion transporter [Burkholderiaceae bacterium]|nr:SulP family inorganic anion transporter [Burkholderiaceae bacterium]
MSRAAAGSNWWRSLFQTRGAARGDLLGGLTAAVVLLAVEGSYGLIAFARLGPEQAQLGFVLGVCTAALASVATAVAGGRGPLLSGSSAALALLVPTLIGALIVDPRFLGANGQPLLPLLLAFIAFGVVLAGIMQVLLALSKLGGLIRYVPYPVHAGYMNGVAVLMVMAMLPHLLGLPAGQGAADWRNTQLLAPVVALTALVLAVRPPRWTRRVPAYLTGLLAATVLHHVLSLTPLAGALGPLFNAPRFEWPGVDAIESLFERLGDGLLRDKLWLLVQFAAAAAFVSSLQTALAGSTIDELTHQRGDRGRALLQQGVANVAVGFMGGLPSAGAVGRSKVSVDAGGLTAMSRIFFGVGLLLALVFGLRYMSFVPMAAVAGVFAAVAYSLVDAWTRRATGVLWRQTFRWRLPRALAQSYGVMLLVAGIAVFVSLPLAIGVGVLVAILMFIRSNIRQPIRQIVHADRRTSRKVRPAADAELLRTHGARIVLLELDGALFFGTAEAADEEIERLVHISDQIVIDFERVSEVDASGARVLLHAADAVRRAGRMLLFAGLRMRGDPRMRMIRDMDVHDRLADAQFFPDADRALEHAEDRLLSSVARAALDDAPLTLAEALVGSGLDADELEVLSSMMVERRIAKGEAVFRYGDPGDSMFVLLQGQIGIWLPAAHTDGDAPGGRRLISFAPGVVFGDMGLLAGVARSADAIAESDALLLELQRAEYERLVAEHPAVFGKLLLNISLLLASRVRSLSDELQATHAVG